MTLAKVKSEVLTAALKDKNMFALDAYIGGFLYQRTEDGCFLSQIVNDDGKPTLAIRLSLFDYTFNEPESQKIWDIAEKTIGKREIDLKVVNIVTL